MLSLPYTERPLATVLYLYINVLLVLLLSKIVFFFQEHEDSRWVDLLWTFFEVFLEVLLL